MFPSVTEILRVLEKPYYDRWRHRVGRKEADRVMQEAQVFGTRLHAAARAVATGADAVEPEMKPYAAAVEEFLERHVGEVLGAEVDLVSPEYRFGGTLDLYCQLKDGAYAVIDWKTTSSLSREHGLQTAAYALLVREQGWRINRRIVVRVKKEKPGAYYARTYREHAEDLEAFLACRTVWWWMHKRRLDKHASR